MGESNVEDAIKGTIKILDENYYIPIGDRFVCCTVPRENDPTMSLTRKIVEDVCDEITRLMELRSETK